MKKKLICALTVLVVTVLTCVPGAARDSGMTVFVTVADGELKLAHEPVQVYDVDGDENLTLNDVLFIAHEMYFRGGAEKGYASFAGDYGLAVSKLWGNENGTGFGYYINDVSAFSLSDPVAKGDKVVAFVYADTEGFSDEYCYFDSSFVETGRDGTVSLTLFAAGYDENWAPVTLPLEGAVITVNGERTDLVTDENGRVSVSLEGKKDVVISAVSDERFIVPPVCFAEVDGPDSEDRDWKMIVIVVAVVVVGGITVFRVLKQNGKK